MRRALLMLILLLAAFLRLYRITTLPPGLYRDEAMEGASALQVLETRTFHVFYPEDNGREGLYVNLAALFVYFLGNEAWVLRLPAAIFGILTVWGVYQLAAEWESAPIGLLAAFFTATSFWHIVFSREAFRAIGAPLFFVWSLYCLTVAVKRKSSAMVLLAGAVYGMGFYTYVAYRATPLLVIVLLWNRGRRFALPFIASAVVVAAPLMLYFARHPDASWERASQVSVWRAPHPVWEIVLNLWRTGRMIFTRGDINWRHNLPWRAEVFWPVAILFVLGAAIAVRSRSRRVLLLWLAIGALPAALSNQGVPHAMRSILMVPAVFILTAIGAHAAYGWLAKKAPPRVLAATAGVIILALAWEPYHTYFQIWANDPHLQEAFDAPAVEIARQIRLLPSKIPKYVAIPADDPMAPQPIMFLTRSYTAKQQQETVIHYEIAACSSVRQNHPEARVFCLPSIR